jgi:hypothetical protein
MFTSRRAWKIRPARPERRRNARPTTLTMAMPWMSLTSPRGTRSFWIAGREAGSSTVREIETSDVAMRSTDVRCRAKTSNTLDTKPWAMSIRGCEMRTTEIPFLKAMARGSPSEPPASRVMRVPGAVGFIEFRMRTGIPFSTAGRILAGWRTLAPK